MTLPFAQVRFSGRFLMSRVLFWGFGCFWGAAMLVAPQIAESVIMVRDLPAWAIRLWGLGSLGYSVPVLLRLAIVTAKRLPAIELAEGEALVRDDLLMRGTRVIGHRVADYIDPKLVLVGRPDGWRKVPRELLHGGDLARVLGLDR